MSAKEMRLKDPMRFKEWGPLKLHGYIEALEADHALALQAAREQGWRKGAEAGFRAGLRVCEAEPEREKDFQDIWKASANVLAKFEEVHHA